MVSLVTSDKSEYTPNELLKSGIPSFVVERIRLFLEDKVKEELKIESNSWFDADSKLVSQAFEDYLRSAISSSHIPKSELYKVIQTIISGIIMVFIEPRKNMAEYLFREDEELPIEEVESRCATLTIYKHFGTAIPLYMRKRNLDTLTKERCKLLIHKLDEKLVTSYSANDWAQKLEQLFELFGGQVEPRLLATFFEDKGLYGMASKFEGRTDLLDKAVFIEIISSEGFVDFTSIGKSESIDAKNEKLATEQIEKISEEDASEHSLIESFFGNYEYVPGDESQEDTSLADQYSEGGLSDDEMSELLSDIASEGVIGLNDYDEGNSLNELFSLGTEGKEEEGILETSEEIAESIKRDPNDEINTEFRDNLISILDQAKTSFDGIENTEEEMEAVEDLPVDIIEEETEEVLEVESPDLADTFEETPEAEDEEQVEEGEEKPMWAQFLNQDQMDVLMGGERSAEREQELESDIAESFEEEIEVEGAMEESSIFEEEAEVSGSTEVRKELEDILESRRDEFIEVIFNESSGEYEDALNALSTFETWKETSTFIQEEIFAKNDVDMFSGATVDFTDRMHQYFNKPRNT
ncbi:MAG: hypothetical protein ED557_07165 [Balneola sp.]|nr:MAG: hypothetical protein ED557_07165 [Balneola sp.]